MIIYKNKLTPRVQRREMILPHHVLVLVNDVQPTTREHDTRPCHHPVQFSIRVPPPLLR